jgi:hypothetical protein
MLQNRKKHFISGIDFNKLFCQAKRRRCTEFSKKFAQKCWWNRIPINAFNNFADLVFLKALRQPCLYLLFRGTELKFEIILIINVLKEFLIKRKLSVEKFPLMKFRILSYLIWKHLSCYNSLKLQFLLVNVS